MSNPLKNKPGLDGAKIRAWLLENIVTLIFLVFVLVGFVLADGMPMAFFFGDLSLRIFRNAFLVLSLIIPVVAGLGLNFGIVVGAMAGQMAIILVRYYNFEGLSGLLLAALIALPLASLFGYLTGLLYNRTKGQEMIASLIVGFFANGIYQFILLFAVGGIIPVSTDNQLILANGVGVRSAVDLGTLKNSLDRILTISFPITLILLGLGLAGYAVFRFLRQRKSQAIGRSQYITLGLTLVGGVGIMAAGVISTVTMTVLSLVSPTPVVTGLLIALLCAFTYFISRTKMGQDFRSVGQSQHIAEISGINVNRTRIIATIMSTVLASWGHIIYMQNMGTLATYDTHRQIGLFSVAALLVGGATTSKATIKQALIGTLLFNAMFIMSPEIGKALFSSTLLGEYFRTFMVYGVIGVALGLYVWKSLKKSALKVEDDDAPKVDSPQA